MSEQQTENTYKNTAKGIAIFGGLQIFKILLSIVRTKCSAVFLGPSGFGVYSLISSTLTSIEMATNCGLGTSAVKDISQAEKNIVQVAQVYKILNRLVWITGLLAALLCAAGAKWLSISAFGNTDYTWAFVLGAISLLFSQLLSGQGALLVGLRKYNDITKLNIWTNILSLIFTIIFYWRWGAEAIIPVILISSVLNIGFSAYYAKQINLPVVIVSIKETLARGKGMLKMGILISLSGTLTVLAGYAMRIFILHASDIVYVGLFTAVFSLVNTYLGMVFSSMERDFFPRLCSVSKDSNSFITTIRQQNEMLILLLAPVVAIFMVFAPAVISVFYSAKFTQAESMMSFTVLAMFFKAPSWTMSIAFLSKGDTRTYFTSQLAFCVYSLLLNMAGFHFWGLTGLGISFIPTYVIYVIHTYLLCRKKYGFSFGRNLRNKMLGYSALLFSVCAVANCLHPLGRNLIGSCLILMISILALRELNTKLKLMDYLRKKLSR